MSESHLPKPRRQFWGTAQYSMPMPWDCQYNKTSVWVRMTYAEAGRRAALIVGTLLILVGRSASRFKGLDGFCRQWLGLPALAELVLAADTAEVLVVALHRGQQRRGGGCVRTPTQKPLEEQHSSLPHLVFLFLGPHLMAAFGVLSMPLSQ